ncbi:hypothetical protein HY605_04965 [Candidatus Peregrinibacteria bacterium]|nr:hypothetical protein [Candidatus Peregrinibacteria bacterium]
MPKIQIINAPIPTFVDPWSKVVESTIGGVISVRQEVFGGGDDFTRVGDIQASLTRDQVFGNVLSLIRGVTMLGGPGYRGNIKQSGVKLVNDDNGIALLNDRVLYFKGDTNPNLGGYVTIDDTIKSPTSDVPSNQYINWQNHQTIIVDGANLLIKDNLWPKDDNGTLDIVVLRRPNQNRGVAGNILIDNDVTNIKANIFADGGVFSYDGEKYTDTEIQTEITNFGYPKYMITKTACPDPVLDYLAYVDCMDGDDGGVENLKHQFKLLGSIYSRNTIGGAKHSNPNDPKSNFISTGSVNGYGEALTSIEEALAYDLKLFRFYHLNFMRCELDGVPGTIEGVEFDGTLTPGTCEHDFSLDTEDQVICREAAVDARMEIDGQACFGANNWSLNNQGVIIEYQPYAILSPVFRLAR